MWGLPMYGPMPFQPVYLSHLEALGSAQKTLVREGRGEIACVGTTDRMYTHSAENYLARACLEGGFTHLFLTEQDMVLPRETIPRLLALDQPVASGLYFLRGGKGQPCLYQKAITVAGNPYPHSPVSLFPTDRPFRCHCPGLGCVLIRREVFERVAFPWFDLKEAGYGSDMYFYTKVREAGLEVWVDPRVRCGHMDYTAVDFDDYARRLQEDPAFATSGFLLTDPAA